MTRTRLSEEHRNILVELYTRTGKTADDLPYSDEFESLYTEFIARSGLLMTRHDVWRALTNQRKAKRLPRRQR